MAEGGVAARAGRGMNGPRHIAARVEQLMVLAGDLTTEVPSQWQIARAMEVCWCASASRAKLVPNCWCAVSAEAVREAKGNPEALPDQEAHDPAVSSHISDGAPIMVAAHRPPSWTPHTHRYEWVVWLLSQHAQVPLKNGTAIDPWMLFFYCDEKKCAAPSPLWRPA